MAISEIVDSTVLAQTFPAFPSDHISRVHLVESLDTMLNADISVVTVEGPESIGKTLLLAEFGKSHASTTVSLFINAASPYGYAPEVLLRDLCNQVTWLLTKEPISEKDVIDEAYWRTLLFKLQTRATNLQRTFYFVVDGIYQIPRSLPHVRQTVLSWFPFGQRQFKFVISGEWDETFPNARINRKAQWVPGFSPEEAGAFFRGAVPQSFVDEVYRVCKIPGYLAGIKRLLDTTTPSQLLASLPQSMPAIFQREWASVDISDNQVILALAILAHDKHANTVTDLALLVDTDVATLRRKLSGLPFLIVSANDSVPIAFISDAFKGFAANQLSRYSALARGRIIETLAKEPYSDRALIQLPQYLYEANELQRVLDCVSRDYLYEVLRRKQSVIPVQQNIQIGLNTALQLQKHAEAIGFGIQQSTIASFESTTILPSEIEARMALGDADGAIQLAQSAVLKIERLRFLAVIGRIQKESGSEPTAAMVQQIEQLFAEVDEAELRSSWHELSADLMHFRPDLGLRVVEANDKLRQKDDRRSDWALARLAVVAGQAESRSASATKTPISDMIRSKIGDPEAQRFSTSVGWLIGGYSADQIIAEVQRLPKATDQLYLLRQWASHIRRAHGAERVIEFALSLGIKTADYTPHAIHLRELADALEYIEPSAARGLVSTFDAQSVAAIKLGPTEDYVRLQLRLAEAEVRYDVKAASTRLLDLYFYVTCIEDLSTRSSCVARFAAALEQLDPSRRLEDREELTKLVEADLQNSCDRLLNETADHYAVTKELIGALVPAKTALALSLTQRLNVLPRRDLALRDLFRHVAETRFSRIPFEFAESALDYFTDPDYRDQSLLLLLDRCSRTRNIDSVRANINSILPLI